MKRDPSLRTSPWLALLSVLLVLLLVIISFVEYRARYRDLLQLYQDQASMTAAVIAQSGVNQSLLTEELQGSYIDRAADVLSLLNKLDREHRLSPQNLESLITEDGVFELSIFDKQGLRVEVAAKGNRLQRGGSQGGISSLSETLQPLLTGDAEWAIENKAKDAAGNTGSLLVGAARSSGGAFVLQLDSSEQSTFEYLTTLEIGLEDLIKVRGMEYLILDIDNADPFTISKSVVPMDSSWQRKSLEDILYEVSRNDTIWLEVIRPVFFQNSFGEVRIGFDSSSLYELRDQIIYQLLLRSLLILVLAVVSFWYVITRQNAALLEKEKSRIEAEVIRLEKLNRLREKQAAMGELAAGVAHEIRNPLNAIGIAAQRLKREFEPSDSRDEYGELTGSMVSEIGRINNSLQEFLDYTKPTAITPASIDLSNLLQEVLGLYVSQANEAGVDLSYTSEEITIEADASFLKQALSNLVKNGLDACSRGGKVIISTEAEGDRVKIHIKDNGVGIPQENLSRIFDLYFSTKDMGTGVGLALTHKIIADHHGYIEVASSPGTGSHFEINLPVVQ